MSHCSVLYISMKKIRQSLLPNIGDEPGFFGDATYAGVSVKMSLQLFPFEKGSDKVTVIVEGDGLAPDRGYPGHKVILRIPLYAPISQLSV